MREYKVRISSLTVEDKATEFHLRDESVQNVISRRRLTKAVLNSIKPIACEIINSDNIIVAEFECNGKVFSKKYVARYYDKEDKLLHELIGYAQDGLGAMKLFTHKTNFNEFFKVFIEDDDGRAVGSMLQD